MSFIFTLFYFSLPPLPVESLRVYDTPDDAGESITIEWVLSPDNSVITGYIIFREEKGASVESLTFLEKGTNRYEDTSVKNGIPYRYFLRTVKEKEYSDSELSEFVISKAQWFHSKRWNVLILLLLIIGFLLYYIQRAKKGEKLFIRRIPALDAIDEAVGRSTEMGRPVLYILGLGFISDIPTIAGLSILKRVSSKCAQYETDIIVPCYDPIVYVAAQEVVKEGFTEAGRPDLFNPGSVFFLSYDQFGYAAGVDGIMVREKPGANFFQGYFYAESLILAETGASIGAIQISGTTAVTQLPFFIAATDYTLIGEEMYAASAYIDKDPKFLSMIKGEDFVKILLISIIVIGSILETIALLTGNSVFRFLTRFFSFL